jgi:hypothetical protein
VAVGGEHEGHVEPFACGIALGLVESVARREGVLLGFDERDGDRLSLRIDLDAENVVNLSARTATGLAADDLDGPGRFLATDQVFRPAAFVDCGVD